jgi:signal transduction histidine kinase
MSSTNERQALDKGAAPLRPRARIMRTLGDELISSEAVAVIELVKNAYDADATRVLVRFRPPLEPGEGGIDILDDGSGMTLDTVREAWLEPATPFRRQAPRSEELGRPVLGEKGIGRFAVSRLADDLELVTRRPGAAFETRVLFDWRLFNDDEAYLDDIAITWEQSAPLDIGPGGVAEQLWPELAKPPPERLERGTLLRMNALRTHWGTGELRKLRTALSRLVSPSLFEAQRDNRDRFTILFQTPPGFEDLSGVVEPPEALRNPHYTLHAHVDEKGRYRAMIRLPGRNEPVERNGQASIDDRMPSSGPFDIELRVWDRDRDSMLELASRSGSDARTVRRDLNEAAGVNVYRDGFRVLPYGEPGNDWLQLDARRVQNPTLRLSNNQVVGYLLISRTTNPDLRDQTNREGLIRNQAFDDLVRQVRELIGRLEQERYLIRPREESGRKPGGLFAGLDLATVRAYVQERYADDKRLAGLLGEAQQNVDEAVERVQEVVSRYRRLATLGELIDTVLHNGRAPLAKIGGDADLALRQIARAELPTEELVQVLRRRLEHIRNQHNVLATVFRRIEPFGGRRRGRPVDVVLEDVIADSFGVLEGELERIGAKVELPASKTPVTVDEAELQEVFVNLLTNSIYWLSQVDEDHRHIRVEVSRDEGALHVLFSDSGAGVREDVREWIYEPYFTTKEDGVGLGLSIAGEIVKDYYDGELALLDSGPLPGANFLITLRRRV